jgi:predicted dehydrogenase
VHGSGGVYRYKDGREAHDHVYSIFEYPSGVTATFSSVESNANDQRYEAFFGTKGTLIMYNESDALLFDETAEGRQTSLEVARQPGGAALDATETKRANNGKPVAVAKPAAAQESKSNVSPSEYEISTFCSAIREGTALRCGPDRALDSARACIAACEAAKQKTRLTI